MSTTDSGHLQEGEPSPHEAGEPGAIVTMSNSVRLGRQRPFCTGCGGPLDIDDGKFATPLDVSEAPG